MIKHWKVFLERPLVFKLLLILCLFLAISRVVSLYLGWGQRADMLWPILSTLLWIAMFVGFCKLQKWAWAILDIAALSSLLNVIELLLFRQIGFRFSVIPVTVVSVLIVIALNLEQIRTLFSIDVVRGKEISYQLATYALICFSGGLSLFVRNILQNVYPYVVELRPAMLYTGALGLSFILVGIGVWRLNRFALQAVQPLLIFAILSTFLIIGYGFLYSPKGLNIGKAQYYCLMSACMLIYWLKYLRKRIPERSRE